MAARAANDEQFRRPYLYDLDALHTPGDISTPISPFVPTLPQYKDWEEMSKRDRRLAMAQVAIEVIGQTLDNRLGRTILAIQEPVNGKNGNVRCKQKISMKKYYLNCGIKF